MRAFAAEAVFWLHLVIVLFWVSLFFVPVDWWQGRISFHFYFSLVVILHQFVWGAIIMPWTKRYRMVCILTTLMQYLRGFKLSRVENYGHSFTEELFARARVNVPAIVPTILTLSIVAASFTLYFLPRSPLTGVGDNRPNICQQRAQVHQWSPTSGHLVFLCKRITPFLLIVYKPKTSQRKQLPSR